MDLSIIQNRGLPNNVTVLTTGNSRRTSISVNNSTKNEERIWNESCKMCYIDNTFKSCLFSYSEVLNLVKNHMTPFHHHRFPIKQELVTLKKVPASKLLCHWWHRLLHNHLYLQRLYLHQFVLVRLSISAFASLNNYHDLYSTAQKQLRRSLFVFRENVGTKYVAAFVGTMRIKMFHVKGEHRLARRT